jgi:hypothetical protein
MIGNMIRSIFGLRIYADESILSIGRSRVVLAQGCTWSCGHLADAAAACVFRSTY